MNFRNLLWLVAAVLVAGVLFFAFSTRSHAQMAPDVNCSALRGTDKMCVKNASHFPITAIQAVNGSVFSPNNWINIPGGVIQPGGTAIVKFNAWAGGCTQSIFVRTSTGNTHPYLGVNVCDSSSFIIRGW